ncbi:MAG: GMC oxidoreductase, partial [Candidatus Binatia bacterium]
MPANAFDAVIVGSGFGGAVTACRLAEAGYGVLVLERGRRWDPTTFPRKPGDPWLWDHAHPELENGWLDLRVFPHMAIAAGCGVGGGSLVYANVSIDARRNTFEAGWPPEITYDALEPHYRDVDEMLQSRPLPNGQWTERTRLVKLAAERAGAGERFRLLDLAVSFDEDWSYRLPDPHSTSHSKPFTNAHGKQQGTCVHLGNCDIGCDVNARNTLDLNYLARAESRGAEIRPLHLVRGIAPAAGGYRVSFDRIEDGELVPGEVIGRLVILAAGSLGSTEILLRCRDELRTLPELSAFLGRNWSSNGDFLTPAIHPPLPGVRSGRLVNPTRGPTITAAVDFLDSSPREPQFFIEDGGFPDVAEEYLRGLAAEDSRHAVVQALIRTVRFVLSSPGLHDHVMPWFAQGRDAADGVLSLRGGKLFLDWDVAKSEEVIEAILRTHERFAVLTGGIPFEPLTWKLSRALITPHPLGGCNMGRAPADGVVDHKGEVFGHRNLYVADGAIVPEAIGLNPSKTIA